jgi:hypothetical protein
MYMTPANLCAIALLILIVWRFVFAGLHRRARVRAMAAPQRQGNRVFERCTYILERACAAVIADKRFENSSDGVDANSRKNRAETYLRRIVALTGAVQMDNGYALDVGTMRFHVRDRHVSRLRDVADPASPYQETCFYPVHKGMPKVEEIATLLLQLRNNPALFDKWVLQNGLAFKADGQVFSPAQ